MTQFIILPILLLLLTHATARADERTTEYCTYKTYKWNVALRKAVDFETVRHPYHTITGEEIDPVTGCTVCEEDQEMIRIDGIPPFLICRKIAPLLKRTLEEIGNMGDPLFEVTGYRVGKTKGDTDSQGNRTLFSNHAFGVAVDINPGQNGLYDNCLSFGEGCRLIQGGPWIPDQAGTLTGEGATVRSMKAAGFKWGGEIAGKQKDFMHFSLSGY